ncbi:MAG: leucine-rich repeat domain-containing protein [Planctomycetota bacterium]|jgi:hypothetical protein
MTASSDGTGTQKRRRRRFQFTIRSLLVLMTVFALWLGFEVSRARRQQKAVETILKLGGRVTYDWEVAGDSYGRSGRAKPIERPGPAWLRSWLGDHYFDTVVQVGLHGRPVTDDDMAALGGLTELEYLTVSSADITDRGLAHLRGLTKLRHLWLNSTRITDAGLRHLSEMQNLQSLYVASTGVLGPGLRHLAGLANLQSLDVSANPIEAEHLVHLKRLAKLNSLVVGLAEVTDRTLEHLRELKTLKQLWVRHPNPAQEDIERLVMAFPRMRVEVWGPDPDPSIASAWEEPVHKVIANLASRDRNVISVTLSTLRRNGIAVPNEISLRGLYKISRPHLEKLAEGLSALNAAELDALDRSLAKHWRIYSPIWGPGTRYWW